MATSQNYAEKKSPLLLIFASMPILLAVSIGQPKTLLLELRIKVNAVLAGPSVPLGPLKELSLSNTTTSALFLNNNLLIAPLPMAMLVATEA